MQMGLKSIKIIDFILQHSEETTGAS